MSLIKSGDLIGFSGRDYVSDVINLGTLGIPRVSIHHVGIVAVDEDCGPLLYESVSAADGRPPCCKSGKPLSGCQAHRLAEIVYVMERTAIWHYPLRRDLYRHEEQRLIGYLDSKLGASYDLSGAVKSGGVILKWIAAAVRAEDTSSFFCSEWCADALVHIGLLQTPHVGTWNPNRLLRHLRRRGICGTPRRLK